MRGEPATSFSRGGGPFPPPEGGIGRSGGRWAILRQPRRSGRVAEGGALLRRYGGECLHRGFESLLLRFSRRIRLPDTLCGLSERCPSGLRSATGNRVR